MNLNNTDTTSLFFEKFQEYLYYYGEPIIDILLMFKIYLFNFIYNFPDLIYTFLYSYNIINKIHLESTLLSYLPYIPNDTDDVDEMKQHIDHKTYYYTYMRKPYRLFLKYPEHKTIVFPPYSENDLENYMNDVKKEKLSMNKLKNTVMSAEIETLALFGEKTFLEKKCCQKEGLSVDKNTLFSKSVGKNENENEGKENESKKEENEREDSTQKNQNENIDESIKNDITDNFKEFMGPKKNLYSDLGLKYKAGDLLRMNPEDRLIITMGDLTEKKFFADDYIEL